jgi:thiol-disulfide isomerase/thioredoxin
MFVKKFALFFYGFTMASIWSACFLDGHMADGYTAALGLSFTFLSIYFLQRQLKFSLTLVDKLMILIMPVVFLVGLYVNLTDFGYFWSDAAGFSRWYMVSFYLHLINPGLIAFILLVLGLTWLKDLRNPANVFVFTFITLFFAYSLMPEWRKRSPYKGKKIPQNTENRADKNAASKINDAVKLANFSFINPARDTISLPNGSDKYILLETWSEACPPCRRAMQEMPEYYRTVADKLSVYYVYENIRMSERNNFDKIFSFDKIQDPANILIDINQEFSKATNMIGYPYFVLFDPKGNLLTHVYGYSSRDSVGGHISRYLE